MSASTANACQISRSSPAARISSRRGDAQLLLDEIDPGHELGDGMFDLEARIHLEKVELAVRREDELDRARIVIVGGPGDLDRTFTDRPAERRSEARSRRLLDQLLEAALDGAVSLAQMKHLAVAVGEDLDLDVARRLDVALGVDPVVLEITQRRGAREQGRLG